MESQLIITVIDALDAESIPYMLAGSIASMVYGIPRSTMDVDFVIEMERASFERLVNRLSSSFELDPQQHLETLTWTRRHILTARASGFKVELFIKGEDRHHMLQWQRKRVVFNPIINKSVWMPAVEVVVVQKIRWGRPQDLVDAEYVIAVQGLALDMPYIRHWCAQHGTLQRLEDILRTVPRL
jgi:hypothetical protein